MKVSNFFDNKFKIKVYMNRKIVVTPKGYLTLKIKIARLEKKQKETAERLDLNRGDISENSVYIALEEKNLNLLREIEESKIILERAEVCEEVNDNKSLAVGSIVTYL